MKYIFNIINSVCVILMAYFCVDIIYRQMVPQTLAPVNIQEETKKINPDADSMKLPRVNPGAKQMITKRNLFKVEVENSGLQKDKPSENINEKLEPTTLSLILYGTVIGPDETYAVIEDKKVRQQDLYNVGDKVQGAEIKQILRHKVILLFQGRRQVLVMEEKPSRPSTAARIPAIRPPVVPPALPDFKNIEPDQLPQIASNLMRQIKFRQHTTEGEPDGLMVYGIRPSSIFRKIGLRNGDIVQQVNGIPVLSQEDAVSLLGEVMQSDQARLTLMRRGKIEEVVYDMPEGLQEVE